VCSHDRIIAPDRRFEVARDQKQTRDPGQENFPIDSYQTRKTQDKGLLLHSIVKKERRAAAVQPNGTAKSGRSDLKNKVKRKGRGTSLACFEHKQCRAVAWPEHHSPFASADRVKSEVAEWTCRE
jgi:hypothetical protein